jgi:hypothetical protein
METRRLASFWTFRMSSEALWRSESRRHPISDTTVVGFCSCKPRAGHVSGKEPFKARHGSVHSFQSLATLRGASRHFLCRAKIVMRISPD